MHISQKRIGTEDFMMYKTFQEYFFTGFQGFQAEKISPDRSFVFWRKGPNPTGIFDDQIDQEDIQTDSERKYKRIVIHSKKVKGKELKAVYIFEHG